MKPTPTQITAEIAALEACKAYAPPKTVFGEDNHAMIDAQIEFLRGDVDMTAPVFDDLPWRLQDAIVQAEGWKEGQIRETPSSGWDLYKPKG